MEENEEMVSESTDKDLAGKSSYGTALADSGFLSIWKSQRTMAHETDNNPNDERL